MTLASEIDMRDSKPVTDNDLVLGEDWVSPQSDPAMQARRRGRGFISINRSPLARKIITFNLLALIVLVAGVLWLNPVRDNLVLQREAGLIAEAHLIADVFEAQLPETAPVNLITGDGIDVVSTLAGLNLTLGMQVHIYDKTGVLVATTVGQSAPMPMSGRDADGRSKLITDFLNTVWETLAGIFASQRTSTRKVDVEQQLSTLLPGAMSGQTMARNGVASDGGTVFFVATPILQGATAVGAIAVSSPSGEIDDLVRSEREQVLQMFVIAILVSIGLSLVLASTIANPLSDLAAAAEFGGNSKSRNKSPARVRIPDLSGRPDEIGRLSGAMRGMVNALYERIDSNEQFAADVAHEIKNPLASLRSAIGTMRVAKREDQRDRLLDVIEHDVRRLDRLVSDISNASRLDSELVKEEEEPFDLMSMLTNLTDFLGNEAQEKGIEFIADMPSEPIEVLGLEARLAQVFVNLISNAVSFCEEGDAIRVWARRRDNRVLVVVEDTGPGIPEAALGKIFNRFYSERPEGQFGNNSGLGLAISKQIVEAHSGVIWAENIRPTDADLTSDPLGARFVVGLPV
ncbi:MAG: sensor histidine kinase [Rhodobacter sp.]|nr:sensor histidine kinase [Rhodobacter sp.]